MQPSHGGQLQPARQLPGAWEAPTLKVMEAPPHVPRAGALGWTWGQNGMVKLGRN